MVNLFPHYSVQSCFVMVSSQSSSKVAAIISRPNRPEVAQVVPGLLAWLAGHDYKVVIDEETSQYTKGPEIVSRAQMSARTLNLVVVLGGDGTLISAARATAPVDVPLLGVNLGSLGFLTEVPLAALFPMLDKIAQGNAAVEQRALMQCDLVRNNEILGSYLVFNDAVVNKTALARLNEYDLFVDKMFVSNYRADGVIVATPTGSTAYSLSAGGPVLMPTVKAFVITPVSPHSLTHRPLVVPDAVIVEILLRSGGDAAYLSLDGQPGVDLQDGDQICCRRSEHSVSLFRTNHD